MNNKITSDEVQVGNGSKKLDPSNPRPKPDGHIVEKGKGD
jgi:hypothetical protein